MLYVPMLKVRQEEEKVSKTLQNCFDDNIIPLFEILVDKYKKIYETDPVTGKNIREEKICNDGKSRFYKIPIPEIDENIITLDTINKNINNKKAFIEFYRFSLKEFPSSKIKLNSVKLAYKLNNDLNSYLERTTEIANYDNFIPVISIKKEFEIPEKDLKSLFNKIHLKNKNIALRITDDLFELYKEFIISNLSSNDYLLFDICEHPAKSKINEFKEVAKLEITAKIILLNSPRLKDLKNSSYSEQDYTELIDTSIKNNITENGFWGFGDYCGLKNDLPHTGGGKIGSALILFFDGKKNKFFSYCNHDTNKGTSGYIELVDLIKSDQDKFDPENNCFGYKKINSLTKFKSWTTWINVCLQRTISEMYKLNHNDK